MVREEEEVAGLAGLVEKKKHAGRRKEVAPSGVPGQGKQSPLPPGTMGWPYIGETFRMYSQDPTIFFATKIKRFITILLPLSSTFRTCSLKWSLALTYALFGT